MELNYAKEVEGVIVYPTDEEFRGIPNWRTHEMALRRRGYMPLAGTPEQRPGCVPIPKTWHKEERTETKIEPRQFYEDVYEEDPETHEMVKTGTRMVIRDTEVQLDKSFILVDEWDYEEIPVPPPAPEPPKQYSKLKLINACKELQIWDSVKADIQAMGKEDEFIAAQDLSSDYPGFDQLVAYFKGKYPSVDVDAILEQSLIRN